MRVSKVLPLLFSSALLLVVAPQLYSQVSAQAQAPGFECYKCTRFAGGIGFCEDARTGETGQSYCRDSNWDCVMAGEHCAVIFGQALLTNETSPAVPGVQGGTLRLVAIAPYLWAGADCKNGLRTFVSTSPDLAVGLVELTPRTTEFALR